MDYADVDDSTKKFIVLRHDIEFSIERAFAMACIESEAGISSSYLVQLTNNTYNALSQENIRMLKEMLSMGHKIGLHYHMKSDKNAIDISADILYEVNILEKSLEQKVDRFSFHRPPIELLKGGLAIDGLINLYDKKYFSFIEQDDCIKAASIKYISDSRHRWNYGAPDEKTLLENDKIQLLIHPYSWTEAGLDNAENFASLTTEKIDILWESINSECKHFAEIKDRLVKHPFLED